MNKEEIREKAIQYALAAHSREVISAALLIQEAERIANYIENGEQFLPKDSNHTALGVTA